MITSIIYLGIFIIFLILLCVAGGYATSASVEIPKISGTDNDYKQARSYLLAAAVICWLMVFFILVGIGLYLFFFWESLFETLSWVAMGLMILVIILTIVIGVLSAAAAAKVHSSKTYTGEGHSKSVWTNCIIAACIALGSAGLLIVTFIAYIAITVSRQKKKKEKQK